MKFDEIALRHVVHLLESQESWVDSEEFGPIYEHVWVPVEALFFATKGDAEAYVIRFNSKYGQAHNLFAEYAGTDLLDP